MKLFPIKVLEIIKDIMNPVKSKNAYTHDEETIAKLDELNDLAYLISGQCDKF